MRDFNFKYEDLIEKNSWITEIVNFFGRCSQNNMGLMMLINCLLDHNFYNNLKRIFDHLIKLVEFHRELTPISLFFID